MDQKLLTFLTLCRTMNYRRAADALHLTQPAVTKQIQSLESQYDVKLFSYDERKLRKTAQGEILERYAMELQYNNAELARLLAAKPKTLLRIGATKSIGDYILIPEIQRFLESPENELFFTVDNTAHLLSQLEAGALDFVVLEGIFDKRRYDHFLLREEPYIGICAADHPWNGKTSILRRCFPSASFCENRAQAHEISWSASLPSRAIPSRRSSAACASAASKLSASLLHQAAA